MKPTYMVLYIICTAFRFNVAGQDCSEYHKYHCIYGDDSFTYSDQSKSALFRRGQSSEIKFVAHGEEEYYISVCAHRKFGDIQFRILEDRDERTLIYDNAADDFAESVIFFNPSTRNLIIEVNVPEGNEKDFYERRCVGVVIQYRKSETTDPE